MPIWKVAQPEVFDTTFVQFMRQDFVELTNAMDCNA